MSKRFRLPKLGKHWLYSVIAGFILLFALLLVVNVNTVNLMKHDKIKESKQIADTVSRSVDHYLLTVQASAAELMLNNQNLALQQAKSEEVFTTASTYRFSELMYNIRVANTLIEDIYVYYPNNDYIVGTEGSYRSKNYFLLGNQLKQNGYSTWKEQVLDTTDTEFFFREKENGEQSLYYRQHIPIHRGGETSSVLVIALDGKEFARILDMTLPHDGSTSISVFTKDGNFYQAGEGARVPTPEEMNSLLENPHEIAVNQVENDIYVGWCTSSDYEEFSYVVVSEKEVLLSQIMRIRYLLIVGLIVCTIVGLCVSLFLSFRHYRSVEKTIANLNEKILWSRKEEILLDILNQKLTEYDSMKGLFQTSGVTLDYINYRLVLWDISFEESKKKIREWLMMAGAALEQECKSVDVIPALKKETGIFLLNYAQEGEEPLPLLCKLLEEITGNPVEIQASEEFMAIEQMVSVYEQTRAVFHHRSENGAVADTKDQSYTLLFERWKKAMRLKEYGEARQMVHPLFENYVCISEDSFIRIERKYAVIHEVLQIIEMEEERYKEHISQEWLEQLKSCDNIEEIEKCLSDILKYLEELSLRYTLKQKDRLADRIKKIIEENYNQNYLGLYYISEQVGVGTSYVSKVFKEEYGIGVVEYMNRLRIINAKKLMETNEMTVKEIAEKVGFTSDIHFIRIFKKYENVTPGVYKKKGNSEKS